MGFRPPGSQPDHRRDLNNHPTRFMRIAFIAMSGVRAHNKELTELGLTLPGFVNRNKIIASMPSLSLLTLAGITPRQHEIHYMEIADLKTTGALPEDFDLV